MSRYELIGHTADVTIRLHATEDEGLFGLFAAGAQALRELLFEKDRPHDDSKGRNTHTLPLEGPSTRRQYGASSNGRDYSSHLSERFSMSAPDPELLLVDWLSALLRHMTVYRRAYLTFDVELFTPTRLCVVATYINEIPSHEIKGITMHNLRITFDGTAWHAEVTVDI